MYFYFVVLTQGPYRDAELKMFYEVEAQDGMTLDALKTTMLIAKDSKISRDMAKTIDALRYHRGQETRPVPDGVPPLYTYHYFTSDKPWSEYKFRRFLWYGDPAMIYRQLNHMEIAQ